jgi:predicted metal-dependent hydrolase
MIGFSSAYWHMAIKDKLHLKASFYKKSYQFFWGKKGLIRCLCWPYLRYLLPSFHPNQSNQPSLEKQLIDNLLLIEAQLKAFLPSK